MNYLYLCIRIMEDSIKIGLDAKRIVRNGTGLGSYGRTLANDLAGIDGLDLMLYAPDKGRDSLRNQVAERENLHFCYPNGLYQTALGKAFWRSKGIISQMQHDGIQVYHGLSGELPVGIRKSGIKSVVTIHDLIFMRHPEYYHSVDVKIYTRKFRQTLQEADRIVAISECTKRDICELGGIEPERVDIIYQSCARRFSDSPENRQLWQVRDKYGLADRYILNVGSIEQRKNVLLAVKALNRLPEDVSLVIVGRHTSYADEILQYVNENRLHDRVQILHGVPDEDLPALYRMADAFVYPSRYEGFGIPIIEAIRLGLPVVACTGSCLEEAGGPDSLYVDPDDDEAMAHAISQVLFGVEGRQRRIELSQEYVKRFENTDAAQRFADLYREML
jgi:glycosyltransferase involved in cell wall biosynthesis